MADWLTFKGQTPFTSTSGFSGGTGNWDLIKQRDKWGYLNNPRWTDPAEPFASHGPHDYTGRESEEPQIWDMDQVKGSSGDEVHHHQCGHWHSIQADLFPENLESYIVGYPSTNARTGPYRYHNTGELFIVMMGDGTYGNELKCIIVNYSPDYGKHWMTLDVVNTPVFVNKIHSFDSFHFEDILYIAVQESYTGRVSYSKFSMISMRWEVVNEEIVETTVSTPIEDDYYCVSIECMKYWDPDKHKYVIEPVIFYQGPREVLDLNYLRGYVMMYLDDAWRGPILVTPDVGPTPPWDWQDSLHCLVQRVVRDRRNKLHFFWQNWPGGAVQLGAGGMLRRGGTVIHESPWIGLDSQRNDGFPGALYYACQRDMGHARTISNGEIILAPRKGNWGRLHIVSYDCFNEDRLLNVTKGSVGVDVLFEGLIGTYSSVNTPASTVRELSGILYIASAMSYGHQCITICRSLDDGATWSPFYDITQSTAVLNQLQYIDGDIIDVIDPYRGPRRWLVYVRGPIPLKFGSYDITELFE